MIHNVTNATELTAALSAAAAGDTVRLAGGSYGTYQIRDRAYSGVVRIESADTNNPARFDGLTVRNVTNVTLAGLDLGRPLNTGEADTVTFNTIRDSNNIVLEGVTIHGSRDGNPQNDGRGLVVTNTRGLLIEDSLFTDLNRGLVIEKGFNVVLRDTEWRTIRSDGVVIAAVDGVVIDGNKFSDFRPVVPDHSDVIQFFNTNQTVGSKNITIQNNEILITNYNGTEPTGTQGIFISDPLAFGYENVLIRNNVLFSNGAFHGINIDGGKRVQVTDNTVLSKTGDSRDFWIRVAGSDGVIVDRNFADNIIFSNVTKLFQGENINLKIMPGEASLIPNLLLPSSAADLMAQGIGYAGTLATTAAPVSNALASALSGSINPQQGQQALRAVQIVDDLDTAVPSFAQVFAAEPVSSFEAAPAAREFIGTLNPFGGDFAFRNVIYSDHFALA